MSTPTITELPPTPVDPDGIDRAQIRAALALNPVDRVRRLEQFIESVVAIRALNAGRTPR